MQVTWFCYFLGAVGCCLWFFVSHLFLSSQVRDLRQFQIDYVQVPFHSVESQVGRKTVYNLQDYETVSNFLKKLDGLHLQEIPYKTRKVVENFSASVGHRWIPCLPHHLSDDEVNQLIGKLPRMLKEGLLPFQLEGVRFGLQRGGRCLIADEMGLGKTLQVIS